MHLGVREMKKWSIGLGVMITLVLQACGAPMKFTGAKPVGAAGDRVMVPVNPGTDVQPEGQQLVARSEETILTPTEVSISSTIASVKCAQDSMAMPVKVLFVVDTSGSNSR